MSNAGHEFDQLAVGYNRHRPEYPHDAMLALADHIEAGKHPDPAVVVDVGAGTGIATRLLHRYLDSRYLLIGVEPGEGMRLQAQESTPDSMGIEYQESTAEELMYDDSALAALVVAQALQWFDRPRFYAEACRVLRPGGTLAVLQNNRDWQSSAFLEEYETFLERNNPVYSRNYRAFDIQSELSAVSDLSVAEPLVVVWERPLTVDEFLGMALSSSRLQQVIDIQSEQTTIAGVRSLANRYADDSGIVPVLYRCELYLARRR